MAFIKKRSIGTSGQDPQPLSPGIIADCFKEHFRYAPASKIGMNECAMNIDDGFPLIVIHYAFMPFLNIRKPLRFFIMINWNIHAFSPLPIASVQVLKSAG